MELPQFLHHRAQIVRLGEYCSSEVICAWNLTESWSWDNTNAIIFQEFHTIEEIWRLVRLFGRFNCFRRKSDLRERIHGSSHLIALHALYWIESISGELRSHLQGCQNVILFFFVQFIRWLARLRRRYNTVKSDLTEYRGTQSCRERLDEEHNKVSHYPSCKKDVRAV